jgi:hypothetical protein
MEVVQAKVESRLRKNEPPRFDPRPLGTDHFGSTVGRDLSMQFMDHYLAAGGNVINTAELYALGSRRGAPEREGRRRVVARPGRARSGHFVHQRRAPEVRCHGRPAECRRRTFKPTWIPASGA